jgi:hypothetical protein
VNGRTTRTRGRTLVGDHLLARLRAGDHAAARTELAAYLDDARAEVAKAVAG